MAFSCLCFPFRRGLRRCKKSIVPTPQPPRCPTCLEPCLYVAANTASDCCDDPSSSAVSSKNAEPPITIPCQQTYHAECLRELFTSTLASSPYHPPRCCGSFVPLSTLYALYPQAQVSEKPTAEQQQLASKLAAFREVTDNPVDCWKCKKWVLPEHIDEDKETANCNSDFGGCGANTCVICNGPAHSSPPASPAGKGKAGKLAVKPGCTKVSDKERSEVRFRRLVGREGWRQCGKCGWMLSRDTGCCEVICRCGHYETLAF